MAPGRWSTVALGGGAPTWISLLPKWFSGSAGADANITPEKAYLC